MTENKVSTIRKLVRSYGIKRRRLEPWPGQVSSCPTSTPRFRFGNNLLSGATCDRFSREMNKSLYHVKWMSSVRLIWSPRIGDRTSLLRPTRLRHHSLLTQFTSTLQLSVLSLWHKRSIFWAAVFAWDLVSSSMNSLVASLQSMHSTLLTSEAKVFFDLTKQAQ